MAGDITVEITGLDSLQAGLEEADDKIAKRAVVAALRAGGVVVQAEMVNLAPKETGIMAEHIDIKMRGVRGESRAASCFIGPNSRDIIHSQQSGKTSGLPRTAEFICRLLEWGGIRQPKHPFLTAAWEAVKSRVLDTITDKLKDALHQ